MTILRLCDKESAAVHPESTVAEAIQLMLARRVGAVVVVDANRVVGIFTERDRIDQAIAALQAVNSTGRPRVGRPPKAARKPRRRGRMSAAARRKMSRMMKQRWAQGKMKPRKKAG